MKKVARFFKSTYKLWFLVGIGLCIFFMNMSSNKYYSELLTLGKFAIGTFEKFNINYYSKGISSQAHFRFYKNGKINHSMFVLGTFPNKEKRKTILTGDQFLVLHNDDGSRILFDFRIRDSTDFIKYVKQFEELRQSWTNGEEALRWFKGINQSGTNNK